jgi:hypothetical protein
MKALSIRQPWAWLILQGGKDIENRTWPTKIRGRVLVHASKGMTRAEYAGASHFTSLPPFENLQRKCGGIVGSVEIIDCVQKDASRWFEGPYGFKLINPKPLPFVPLKGQLGFFEVALPKSEALINNVERY